MNIWTLVFICFCCGLVIRYYYKKQHEPVVPDLTKPCTELSRSGKASTMIVDHISDRAIESVKEFYNENHAYTFGSQCQVERNGDQIKVLIHADTDIYGVASLVNIFAWDEQGLSHHPKAIYPVGKMVLGDQTIENTEIAIYVAEGEDDPAAVTLTVKDGRSYRYDLSNDRVTPL